MGSITTTDYLRMLARLNLKKPYEVPHPVQNPQPEPAVRHEPVGANAGTQEGPSRFLVRIISFRRRLIDPDNLAVKATLDAVRYAGFIPDDSTKFIELSVSQRKSKTDYTEIEVLKL